MLVEHIILALVLILGLSLIAQPVAKWLSMPLASILVLLGYLTSELVVYAGIDTGIRADNFQSIIFYVFIPVLVFESAYNIDKQQHCCPVNCERREPDAFINDHHPHGSGC